MSEFLAGMRVGNEYKKVTHPTVQVITLESSGWAKTGDVWTKTVAVTGVLADENKQLIQVSPVSIVTNIKKVSSYGILATAQGADTLTFTATVKQPEESVQMLVNIMDMEVVSGD